MDLRIVWMVAGLTACGARPVPTGPPAPTVSRPSPEAIHGSWALVRGGPGVTLTIEPHALRGDSGCNLYRGSFVWDGARFSVGSLSHGERPCMSWSQRELEAKEARQSLYFRRLQGVTYATVVQRRLVLTGPGVTLVFARIAPIPPPPEITLESGPWTLDLIYEGSTPRAPDVEKGFLTFEKGRYRAGFGCNTTRGSYAVERGFLKMTSGGITIRSCAGTTRGDALMKREDKLFGLLRRAFAFKIEGGQLTLLDGDTPVFRYSLAREFVR